MRIGVLGVYRPQFDQEAAGRAVRHIESQIQAAGIGAVEALGLLEEWQADQEVPRVREQAAALDVLVVVMGTFVGADVVLKVSEGLAATVLLWTVPEPGVGPGQRLSLNSLCGGLMTNHAFRQMGLDVPMVYGDPDAAATMAQFLSVLKVDRAVRRLRSAVIGIVGQHPPGYYPCDYDELELKHVFGARVVKIPLAEAFAEGERVPEAALAGAREAASTLRGLGQIEDVAVSQSLKAEVGLFSLIETKGLSDVTVECWPSYMTDYGGAVCWAMSRLIDAGVMAGCEADVYGTLTMIMARELGGMSPFFGDLVHVASADRLVFWHCGAAPRSLAGEDPRASRHPNRKVGLTLDFALKGGPATVLRLHHGPDGFSLMAIEGEAVSDPLYFSGNTAAVKTARPPQEVLAGLLRDGAEHHFAVGYGVAVADVARLAERLEIPLRVY